MLFASLLINLLITVNFMKTEDEIAVDRPRVGSSFRIHESIRERRKFRDVRWTSPWRTRWQAKGKRSLNTLRTDVRCN